MKFDDLAKNSLLYDFYGQLLTKRQREVMELYHEENFSLSEIADEFAVSRQAVHDTLKNAEKVLREYEEKLGLIEKFQKTRRAIEEIDVEIDRLAEECTERQTAAQLKKIKAIIDKLDQ